MIIESVINLCGKYSIFNHLLTIVAINFKTISLFINYSLYLLPIYARNILQDVSFYNHKFEQEMCKLKLILIHFLL